MGIALVKCLCSENNLEEVLNGIDAPFIIPITKSSQMPPDAFLVELELTRIQTISSALNTDNMRCRAKILPDQPICGSQMQQTPFGSAQSGALTWAKPHLFQFIVSTDLENAKVLFSLFCGDKRPIGDALIPLKKFSGKKIEKMDIPLMNPDTGKRLVGTLASLKINLCSKEQAFPVKTEIYYLYQRYSPELGWGSTVSHFLVGDPGKWSSEDHQSWSYKLEDILLPGVEGNEAELEEEATSIRTEVGWEYAHIFRSPEWDPAQGFGMNVRRRAMERIIQEENADREPFTRSTVNKKGKDGDVFKAEEILENGHYI